MKKPKYAPGIVFFLTSLALHLLGIWLVWIFVPSGFKDRVFRVHQRLEDRRQTERFAPGLAVPIPPDLLEWMRLQAESFPQEAALTREVAEVAFGIESNRVKVPLGPLSARHLSNADRDTFDLEGQKEAEDRPHNRAWVVSEATDDDMVLVPAGWFTMGQDDILPRPFGMHGSDSLMVGPAHRVYLDSFYIDRYEVTGAQWKAFVAAENLGGMPPSPRWGWIDDLPIVNITWAQAQSYCGWAGKRLPTEAEWEKAARGTDGRPLPWGETLTMAHVRNAMQPFPVGSFPAGVSPYGAYDMAGNVWEWVADWYDMHYYQYSPAQNPPGPESGSFKVRRGGASKGTYNSPLPLRLVDEVGQPTLNLYWTNTFARWRWIPTSIEEHVGFRCAQSVRP